MYVKVVNSTIDIFPYSISQLRSDNPTTSFPQKMSDSLLASFGVYKVTVKSKPTYNASTQKVTADSTPSLVNGEWVLDWQVESLVGQELTDRNDYEAKSNRQKRDSMLVETDKYGLSDVTMSAEMTTYRQALRDLPTHANWPNLEPTDWPVKP